MFTFEKPVLRRTSLDPGYTPARNLTRNIRDRFLYQVKGFFLLFFLFEKEVIYTKYILNKRLNENS